MFPIGNINFNHIKRNGGQGGKPRRREKSKAGREEQAKKAEDKSTINAEKKG